MKKIIAFVIILTMIVSLAASCGKTVQTESSEPPATEETSSAEPQPSTETTPVKARTFALKGPTGMGIAKLMEEAENGRAALDYEFTIVSSPTEITSEIIAGRFEIAALPINLAATLYKKTEGNVVVIAVNTLGVLYFVENGNTIKNVSDLAGKTIYDLAGKTVYATGKGSTPEYIINYLLDSAGISGKVKIIYLSDGAEVASNVLAEKDGVTIGILPEPAVSSALIQDKSGEVRIALDMSAEWDEICKTPIVQGVIVMSKTFIDEHPSEALAFLNEYEASTQFAIADVDAAAALIEKFGIVPKAAIAKRALPNCNIVCYFVTGGTDSVGEEMTRAMLNVLFDANSSSVGGKLPDDGFYCDLSSFAG